MQSRSVLSFSATKNIKNISKSARYGFQISPTCGKRKPNAMLRITINDVEYLLINVLIREKLPREVNISFPTDSRIIVV